MTVLFLMTMSFVVTMNSVRGSQVPAMFVFGDSLIDPGNNNDLITVAKANYSPYGIDFPEGVTGRFCNGGTVADHLGFLLGLPLIPACNNPNTRGSKIMQGVNYGSAASGILSDSGTELGHLFPMDAQIQHFEETLQELSPLVQGSLQDYLKKSLFFVCIGTNDYLNNYLLPFSDKPKKYTAETYADLLLQQFSRQLKDLYHLGGRKFLIAGVGPIGCMPFQIANLGSTSACVESTNSLVSVFNTKLRALVYQFNANMQDSYFLYGDVFSSSLNIINNYASYGFKYPHTACCGAGREGGQMICLPVLPLQCRDRSDFVFWDPFHPTDAFNVILSKFAYQGKLQDSFPRNVQELVQS